MQSRKLTVRALVLAMATALTAGASLAQTATTSANNCPVAGTAYPAAQKELAAVRAAREAFVVRSRTQEATLAAAITKAETARAQALTRYNPTHELALKQAAVLTNLQALVQVNTEAGLADAYAARKAALAKQYQAQAQESANALAVLKAKQATLSAQLIKFDAELAQLNIEQARLNDDLTYQLFKQAVGSSGLSTSSPLTALRGYTLNATPDQASTLESLKAQTLHVTTERTKVAGELERQQRDLYRLQTVYGERLATLSQLSSTLTQYTRLADLKIALQGVTTNLSAALAQRDSAAKGLMRAESGVYQAQQQLRALQRNNAQLLANYDANLAALTVRLSACVR